MRRETTMPKPPEIPDEHADAAKSAESSESESDEDEQKMEVETQGKINTPNGKGVQPQSSHIVSHTGKGELEQSCRRILEARMKEINHVFDNGTQYFNVANVPRDGRRSIVQSQRHRFSNRCNDYDSPPGKAINQCLWSFMQTTMY
jgi:hypothetical protein